MHISSYIIAISAISQLAHSAPFRSQRETQQHHPRRSHSSPVIDAGLHAARDYRQPLLEERAPYSVVPVNGSPPEPPATVTEIISIAPVTRTDVVTVDPTSVSHTPFVTTLVLTSTVTESSPVETTVLTTIKTAAAPPEPTSKHVVKTKYVVQTHAITMTVNVPPKSSSTQYYDDGMWHTYYPVKSWEPVPIPSTSSTSTATATSSHSYVHGTGRAHARNEDVGT